MVEEENTGKEMIRRIIKYRHEKKGFHSGNMYVQKILFISKKMGEDVPYRYSLYTYGPYSREIMDDLDEMEMEVQLSLIFSDPNPCPFEAPPRDLHIPNTGAL